MGTSKDICGEVKGTRGGSGGKKDGELRAGPLPSSFVSRRGPAPEKGNPRSDN